MSIQRNVGKLVSNPCFGTIKHQIHPLGDVLGLGF